MAQAKTLNMSCLEDAQRQVSLCDRCGACLPVCPLFGVKDLETSSARGKNALVRAVAEGGLDVSEDLLARMNFCLLCRACTEACPNKVRTDEAMIELRQHLIDLRGGNDLRYRLMAGILKSRGGIKLAAGSLALLRRLGLNGLFPHGLAPDEYGREAFLAAFAGPAVLGKKTMPSPAAVPATAKVAYFQGCGMRMMFPRASRQTREILRSTRSTLEKDNVCCGLPHLAHGMRADFLALARENIGIYQDAEIVVSDCASCSGTLKQIGYYFEHDPLWQERAAAFSRKVMDLTEYLVAVGYSPRRQVDVRLTFHDPCHLARGQGIREEPRQLLAAAGKFVEMREADRCCGGAGSFHLDYPDISAKILDRKRENIERTGAGIVVTNCPGCLIQLTKAAKESGGKFKAMHISQVI